MNQEGKRVLLAKARHCWDGGDINSTLALLDALLQSLEAAAENSDVEFFTPASACDLVGAMNALRRCHEECGRSGNEAVGTAVVTEILELSRLLRRREQLVCVIESPLERPLDDGTVALG